MELKKENSSQNTTERHTNIGYLNLIGPSTSTASRAIATRSTSRNLRQRTQSQNIRTLTKWASLKAIQMSYTRLNILNILFIKID